ncbi:MAG: cation-translocating P-type ATPase [Gemmataceae bacterium]|nr:cation-translocating P-type ATPase [Gemmata sp.]MDW8198690.1 cation-translocating P-type ATPase [Gemmataceae bacterium]
MPNCGHCGGPITGSGHPGRNGRTYCCFGCLALDENACDETCAPDAARSLGWRLGVAILVVGQSMIFGLALNLHDDVPAAARTFTQSAILAGTLVVIALLGWPLFHSAWNELRRGRLTLEALFLVTMAGAMTASLQALLTGYGKIYFEVVSVLLVVYTLGKLIGARARAAALAASRAWSDQLSFCRIVDASGQTHTRRVTEVQPGDVVEVHPGEWIAVDGIVCDGVGFISESAVRGEPFAVVRRPGDRVLAGSISHDARFRIRATAPGTEREVDRLLAIVEAARGQPLSLQARADALGRWFLPLVVWVAIGTFVYWGFVAAVGWETALFYAMSVLLVACPCVIGLATPVVVWSALSRLAERGVIIRHGEALERLASVDRVLVDKTGTLTEDRFTLIDIATTCTGEERAQLLGWLSLVQAHSQHPIAKPFAELPRPFMPGREPQVRSFVVVPGCGVSAELDEADGKRHTLRIGTAAWITGTAEATPPGGEARVFVAVDDTVVAVATVAETLRKSTPQALAHFARLGLPVEVLTGDASGRAEALGLPPARSGLLPTEKHAVVEAVQAAGGKPLFIGDGINDAAALARAHCGIALACGTDLAVQAAAITLYHDDLRVIPWAIEISREALRAVRWNLIRAVSYNLVGITLAACGLLHPVVAALLMVVSSLTLLFSSTRVGHCDETAEESPRMPEPVTARPPAAVASIHRETLPEAGGTPAAWSPQAVIDALRWPSSSQPSGTAPSLTPPSRFSKSRWLARLHGLALFLQGGVFILLLAAWQQPLAAVAILGVFGCLGVAWTYAWQRFTWPHTLDMCGGMLTFGNLGMLLGWWVDNGLTPLADHGCCQCVEAMRAGVMKPWMWVGMLVLANIAMRWLGQGAIPNRRHQWAMFTGGNLGMVFGMLAGGQWSMPFATPHLTVAVLASFLGMTAGMLAGMVVGTWFTERLLVGLAAVTFFPSRWRLTASRTP